MTLSDLHKQLDSGGRRKLAQRAGTSPAYLYQLATRWRGKKPSLPMLAKLAKADRRLKLQDLLQEFA